MRNFTLFSQAGGKTVKIVARYQQFRAVQEAPKLIAAKAANMPPQLRDLDQRIVQVFRDRGLAGLEPGDPCIELLHDRRVRVEFVVKLKQFHWRTLALPPRIIDYIVIHELVHLAAPHHGAGFWKRVELAMPDYAGRKRWLDEQGGEYA